ncbi:sigma-70 family RNA polymerase sigma factor, partial [Escherichia coli]
MSGQTDAFETLMQRHQRRLFCALSQMSGSAETAQDLAQEAFVRAWQRLASFRGDSAFYSWLFRIALNLYMSDRRRHR